MSTVGRALGCMGGVLVLAWASSAWAQNGATAQALFEQGVRDLEAGRLDRACPALAESQRLDPHPGTLFALAECEAKAGKVASAVGHYQDYLGLVSRLSAEQAERHAERAASARAQVEALRPKVPTLALVLPASAPPALIVERDGMALQGPALGVPLPVDPGEHVVVTRLPAGGEVRATVTLAFGEAKRLELQIPAPPPAVEAPGSKHALSANAAGETNTLRQWGWALGGVGLAGVLTGSITGIVVLQKKATVDDHCEETLCDGEGKKAADSGKTLATVSSVAFGVGLTAVAASIVLLIATEPSPAKSGQSAGFTPRVHAGAEGAWLGLERAF
jgi:hypothetical protein